MPSCNRFLFSSLLVLGCSLLVGCVPPPTPPGYTLSITLDKNYAEKIGDDTIFLHVIGLNKFDHFADNPLGDYWKNAGANIDSKTVKMLSLSREHPQVSISSYDDIWNVWDAASDTELLVVSSAPPPRDTSLKAASDPRCVLIPREKEAWDSQWVEVNLTERGLHVATASKAR